MSRTHAPGSKFRSPEYRSWESMRRRCNAVTGHAYAYYGGRGITVCEAWADFDVFLSDVGHRPGVGYTLDRIDNDGNYEPGNVRWGTPTEQARNQRPAPGRLTAGAVVWIRANVTTTTITQMAKSLGTSRESVSKVVNGHTWKEE